MRCGLSYTTDLDLLIPLSQALIETYKVALSQHQELTDATPLLDAADSHDHEEAISRAETILNITSAEIERIDSERNEDLQNLSTQYLQGQIDFHEQVRRPYSLPDFAKPSSTAGSHPSPLRSHPFRAHLLPRSRPHRTPPPFAPRATSYLSPTPPRPKQLRYPHLRPRRLVLARSTRRRRRRSAFGNGGECARAERSGSGRLSGEGERHGWNGGEERGGDFARAGGGESDLETGHFWVVAA